MNLETDNKLIALLTDFGTKDYFVGAMKGAILSINAPARIVDITHDIEPQNIRAASFTLRACYRDFPAKTIFAAVVDPGVGSDRKAVLVETNDYYFIAPDNGLLSFVFNQPENYKIFELTNEEFFARRVSATFHGRDVFAPIAAHLSKSVAPHSFGARTESFVRFEETEPRRISTGEIEAEIIHADRFGNLITNLTSDDLPENFTLTVNETTINKRRGFFCRSRNGRAFYDFRQRGILGNRRFSRFGAETFECRNRR